MDSNISCTNESFDFLRGSSDFLNVLLDNINTCVLLLDQELNLQAFNNAMKTIFTNKKDEDLLYKKCGNAIGCAYQIEEEVECGHTTQCETCEIRESALISYMHNKGVYNEHIVRPYYDNDHKRIDKHLQFSTRLFMHDFEKYIIVLINDITRFVEREKELLGKN